MTDLNNCSRLDVFHQAVLMLLRSGQSESDVRFLLGEELEKLSDASEYLQAIKESNFAP